MNPSHWTLIVLWIVYYALHSVFASSSVKEFFTKSMGKYFRYYRLFYSLFALATLIGLLTFQYSFDSPILIKSAFIKYFSILFLVLPGIAIMLISAKKYFMLLSGIRSIFTPVAPAELKLDGIHRFVRHPLYTGTLLFVFGLFFVYPTLNNLIAAALLIIYVLVGITFEEKKLKKEFGESYENYIAEVPMLIPKLRHGKRVIKTKVKHKSL